MELQRSAGSYKQRWICLLAVTSGARQGRLPAPPPLLGVPGGGRHYHQLLHIQQLCGLPPALQQHTAIEAFTDQHFHCLPTDAIRCPALPPPPPSPAHPPLAPPSRRTPRWPGYSRCRVRQRPRRSPPGKSPARPRAGPLRQRQQAQQGGCGDGHRTGDCLFPRRS